METVLIVILLVIAVAMIGVILLQRSDGGGLGIGGGQTGGLMSVRGTANLLTRTTAILAALFMGISLLLAVMSAHKDKPASLIEQLQTAPLSNDAGAPAAAVPAEPLSVPVQQ